ncbi:MAG: hypothetical protein AB7O38_10065 [Pirellulaceae bacterium]
MTQLVRRAASWILCAALSQTLGGPAAAADKPAPEWTKVTDQAGWQPRDSQAEVAFDDRLWILGGWFNSYAAPPRDVWSTKDGRNWEQVTANAPWQHSDFAMSLVHDGRMWMMGGWFNGRLPGHSASNQVWSSRDGREWQQVTAQAAWSPRMAAGTVVFRGQMWLLGGTENYYFGDAASLKNDVWVSRDGREWKQVTEHAGWSPRAYHQAVVLNDRIYVMGGGNYVPEYHALNDVWSSADGVTWIQETDAAPWSPRLWFSAAVYRQRLWVLGGWSNNPARNWGDVWYSADGRAWQPYETKPAWKERHEHSVVVWRDKLWLFGGHAQPLSSEVWSLELPADW